MPRRNRVAAKTQQPKRVAYSLDERRTMARAARTMRRSLGRQRRRLLRRDGFSHAWFANWAGVDRSAVSRWFSGMASRRLEETWVKFLDRREFLGGRVTIERN